VLRHRRAAVSLSLAVSLGTIAGLAACEPVPPTTTTTTTTTTKPAATTTTVPASNKRTVAVAKAKAQLGKKYEYGSAGPDTFDCSGLTSYAWKAAGITLPRSAADQYAATTRITKAQLLPGDLIFYASGSSVSHVAMYVGDGKLVQARKTGYPVESQDVDWWSSNRVGYGRIKGV
jgi:cell wall-associated NlpC family hydrolase